MPAHPLTTKLIQLERELSAALAEGIGPGTVAPEKIMYDYKSKRADFHQRSISGCIRDITSAVSSIHEENKGDTVAADLRTLLQKLQETGEYQELQAVAGQMKHAASRLRQQATKEVPFKLPSLPRLPPEVHNDMTADFNELQQCFAAGCYRSTVILCGRLLETALHRKYYDATGKDILETSPSIGLGSLVGKLNDLNLPLGPGLTDQIHLINNVRVSSVHKKQQAFLPTKEQAQAIMLFTVDCVRKLFNNA